MGELDGLLRGIIGGTSGYVNQYQNMMNNQLAALSGQAYQQQNLLANLNAVHLQRSQNYDPYGNVFQSQVYQSFDVRFMSNHFEICSWDWYKREWDISFIRFKQEKDKAYTPTLYLADLALCQVQ